MQNPCFLNLSSRCFEETRICPICPSQARYFLTSDEYELIPSFLQQGREIAVLPFS